MRVVGGSEADPEAEPEEVERVLAPGRRLLAVLTPERRAALLARKAAMTKKEWAAWMRRQGYTDFS